MMHEGIGLGHFLLAILSITWWTRELHAHSVKYAANLFEQEAK